MEQDGMVHLCISCDSMEPAWRLANEVQQLPVVRRSAIQQVSESIEVVVSLKPDKKLEVCRRLEAAGFEWRDWPRRAQ